MTRTVRVNATARPGSVPGGAGSISTGDFPIDDGPPREYSDDRTRDGRGCAAVRDPFASQLGRLNFGYQSDSLDRWGADVVELAAPGQDWPIRPASSCPCLPPKYSGGRFSAAAEKPIRRGHSTWSPAPRNQRVDLERMVHAHCRRARHDFDRRATRRVQGASVTRPWR